MPEKLSVPDQCTGNASELAVAGKGATWLIGSEASMVLVQVPVTTGAFWSKTTAAWLLICVPEPRPAFGSTLNCTTPSPCGGLTSGGKKPAAGSVGGSPVAGSSELKVQVTRPVAVFRPAFTLTMRFSAGRRSTSAEYWVSPGGGDRTLSPNEIAPRLKVLRSTLAGSSWSVTTTF